VLEARRRHAAGEIGADALRAAEDRVIGEAVRKQGSAGLSDTTDGEFRRAYFHLDFLKQLHGVSVTGGIAASKSASGTDDGFTPPQLSVTGQLAHARQLNEAKTALFKSIDQAQTPAA
jgi:5-methyltetrahydropteroyltriglutamate--homocysteine methyltransferase